MGIIRVMKYKCYIFDLDGTVLDTLDDLCDSMNYALKTNHFPQKQREEISRRIGNGLYRLAADCLPEGISKEEITKVHTTQKNYYRLHYADKTLPYENMESVLRKLKDSHVKMALVSNKADEIVQLLVERFYPGIFDFVLGESPDVARKPDPASLELVLERFHLHASEAVYIGDSEVDIKTAENAGMDCISVTWGFRSKEHLENAGARLLAEKCKDILNY